MYSMVNAQFFDFNKGHTGQNNVNKIIQFINIKYIIANIEYVFI